MFFGAVKSKAGVSPYNTGSPVLADCKVTSLGRLPLACLLVRRIIRMAEFSGEKGPKHRLSSQVPTYAPYSLFWSWHKTNMTISFNVTARVAQGEQIKKQANKVTPNFWNLDHMWIGTD